MLLEMAQEVSNWASYYICFSKAALFISNILRGTATCNPGEGWTKSNSESISQRSVWSEPELPSGRGRVSEPGKGRGSTPVLVVYFNASNNSLNPVSLFTLLKTLATAKIKGLSVKQAPSYTTDDGGGLLSAPHNRFSFQSCVCRACIFFMLITFITSNWKSYRLPIAAAIVNAQEGASLLVAAIVAYVADECLGRFKAVGYTTAAFITAAGTTFFLEQSDYLENRIGNGFRIPLIYFSVLNSLTTFVTAGLVDFVTSKLCNKNQRKRAFVVRITLGMLVSFLCCITAWKVEYLLLGIMGGLVEAGMEGCFYNLVPGSMKVYELPFKEIVMGMGKFLSILTRFAFRGWFGDESSTSHLDRYFLMLAMISLGSLAFFSVAAYACYRKIAPEEDVVGSNMEMEEGLAQATPASSSGEPLGNPSSAKQLITQEFSTKRLLKGASSPPYFPLHGDSMATNGWNDVGRKSLRNRSFGNRVQKRGGGNSRSN
ncbi:hypothetical protein GOBAR_AA04673 [Gossypium barbadense]|uniref:Uncharacterized protein n=1 Tax=Gossypium barbadense TaxID=3634 RepID=A0A2P5YJW0_GOSBA|nr:hypothetical protein GOBAR_AA04673 [Gossypium barbadense]